MDNKTLKHIAELSRISLSKKELEEFTPQMETILESAKTLQEIDTNNVKPMKRHIPFSQLREDLPSESLKQEDVLKNVKHTQNGLIKIYGSVFGDIEES
jgi:aspartyl-tRNA(Asn)/glutamyl-tRNA(Gln) amidotransferase subunit C